ncbi:hypothetical protein CEP52_003772 [Fusarium oligoseptatum]|uniref:Duf895 domain membrane protein n=1 Tax=Fusarium oligoseptatum TaxID=2604345 RepID=A0A428U7B2_9HYPO|nr:hypothetical protein CEP52_003772 [Fusarium oligoseptatum]
MSTPNAVLDSSSDRDHKDPSLGIEQNVAPSEEQVKPVSRFTRWYRSPLFNVIIVGLISFTQPGIWNALNNTGAGGQQEPYLVNGANSLTFGIMVFGCSLFGILANKIGLKWVLIIGTLGYAPYSAALYTNNRYGVEWFVLFGGATCGIAASALWASEGAIALGYADVKDRGKFTGIWLGLRELGQLIGSSIQLSLNVNSGKRGRVGYTTYLKKVIRSNGTRLPHTKTNKSVKDQFKKWVSLLKRKQFYLLIPILVGFNWNSTYLGIYLVNYFSVRSRALASLTSGIAATAANIFWGWFFDLKVVGQPQLARITWAFLAVFHDGLVWMAVCYGVGISRRQPSRDSGLGSPKLRFMNESHYMFVYWILGTFFDDVETLTLAVGLVRSFESLGSCLAFGVGAAKVAPLTNLIVAFVMFCISLPSTSFAVFLVPERPSENALGKDDDSSE